MKRDLLASAGEELIIPVIEPATTDLAAPATEPVNDDWLCVWCHNRVASQRDRFLYEGKDEFGFQNPEGLRFEIITFDRTLGCQPTGEPTLDHTWFPGHAWSYCLCDRCGQHLGWFYTGQFEFAGLIKSRLARALYVRN